MTKKFEHETSKTIQDWGSVTFGEANSVKAYAERAREELDELIEAINMAEAKDVILAEAADVTILLHRLAGSLNAELYDAVDSKMAINRKRIWTKDGNGTGQHQKTT